MRLAELCSAGGKAGVLTLFGRDGQVKSNLIFYITNLSDYFK